jgi:23S rRNA (uracil-5-)-methyltransferase RumA
MRYTIECLAKGGEGITRVDGKTYFISRTLPGESGEFRVTEEKKGFGRGVVVKCDRVSHFRVKDHCPVRACSGCGFRHVSPEVALAFKAKAVHDNICRQAHVDSGVPVTYWPVRVLDGTRRRIRIHLSRQGAGLFISGTHKIVDICKCLMLPEALRSAVEDVVSNFTWKCDPVLDIQMDLDDEDRVYAEVKVNAEVETPLKDKRFGDARRKRSAHRPFMGRYEHEQVMRYLSDAVARGIYAGALYENRVWGQASIRDIVSLEGQDVVTWRRIGRFAQATQEANAHLHRIVQTFLRETKPSCVIDLFCGAGNFTFRAAMEVPDVLGIEFFGDRETFSRGYEETRQRGDNIGRVQLRLYDLEKGLPEGCPKAEVVIADPARGGMTPTLCEALKSLSPDYILYISCEASCLGRDMQRLEPMYAPQCFHYVDMFPRTADVETVCILKRICEQRSR